MKKTILTILALSPMVLKVNGAELDQYLYMTQSVKESTLELNEKLNGMIREGLAHYNAKNRNYSCSKMVLKFGKRFAKGTESKIGRWLRTSDFVHKLPYDIHDKESYKDNYKDRSIYRNMPFPQSLVKLAPIVNINGFYVGGDKLGHMTGRGLAYFKRYLKARNNGYSIDKIIHEVIKKGISERHFLGLMGSGVFSYGDLEANYQGFRMYHSMCFGPNPRLKKVGKDWKLVRPVSYAEYVNPYMDEIFNPSSYTKKVLNQVQHYMGPYCKDLENPVFRARFRYYQKMARPSLAILYFNKLKKKNKAPIALDLFGHCHYSRKTLAPL